MDYQYPVTIVADRYSGTYSGAKYTAWPLYPHQLPDGHDGGDSECMDFWYLYKGTVGKGNTPQWAFEDLNKKLGLDYVTTIRGYKAQVAGQAHYIKCLLDEVRELKERIAEFVKGA